MLKLSGCSCYSHQATHVIVIRYLHGMLLDTDDGDVSDVVGDALPEMQLER